MSLGSITNCFYEDFGLTVKTAAEAEFYLDSPERDEDTLAYILLNLQQSGIPIYGMNAEDGERQYEIALTPQPLEVTVREIAAIGKLVRFHPKPYPDRPGCGLHLHISLHDASGANLFQKDGEEESEAMLHAIGGLLEIIPEAMLIFAPHEDSYLRFANPDQHTPTHICWGGNNRTAAVRIPSSTLHPDHRHIELRVPGMDADPEAALSAALAGIHHGLKNKITPPPKLYGNAFDKQYGFPPLPGSLKEAEELRRKGTILKRYAAE